MSAQAIFIFDREFNSLLPEGTAEQGLVYQFNGQPSIKDVIEALGVPHTEIRAMLVNGQWVDFGYQLQPDDRVMVHGYLHRSVTDPELTPDPPGAAFILDVHLGKLARLLRLLGFDSLYSNQFSEREIMDIARAEHRIVLTRSAGLLKHKSVTWGCLLRSEQPEEQVKEVIRRYQLARQITPFKRCMVCNGGLHKVNKEAVTEQLEPKTKAYFNDFWQCEHCKRIYWQGSHFERMAAFVNELRPGAAE